MVLVGYSDSEGSEDEQPPQVQPIQNKTGKTAKPAFQKVVDESKPNRIQVSLPSSNGGDIGDESEPVTKRARTTGTFGGFNSFLPAPKNLTAKAAAPRTKEESAQSNGLGRGVNLKTGATPAFSRDPLSSNGSEGPLDAAVPTPAPPEEEVKLVGKPMAFKPLSVSRKPKAKKSVGSTESVKAAADIPLPKPSQTQSTADTSAAIESMDVPPIQAPKKKKSLFSVDTDESQYSHTASVASEYIPMILESEAPAETNSIPQASAPSPAPPAQPNNLSALATSLNLSASERRQLFGRNGPSDAQVAQFNLAAEYQSNRELAESGETAPAHNPVRSIAGGKHSLQQLINNATSQKDALEESFARGKGNKREAGSRYGW